MADRGPGRSALREKFLIYLVRDVSSMPIRDDCCGTPNVIVASPVALPETLIGELALGEIVRPLVINSPETPEMSLMMASGSARPTWRRLRRRASERISGRSLISWQVWSSRGFRVLPFR